MPNNKRRLCIITANYYTFRGFISPWYGRLLNDFDVTVIGNFDENLVELESDYPQFNFKTVKIEVKPSAVSDFVNVFILIKILLRLKFDCLYTMMPKSGFLGQLAGRICGIPVRLHIFTGQSWSRLSGNKRRFYKFFDKLIVYLATDISTDSEAQRKLLTTEGIVSSIDRISVYGHGSICGVPEKKYYCKYDGNFRISYSRPLRLLFMARVTRNKGFLDLYQCVKSLKADNFPIEFVVCGPDEEGLIDKHDLNQGLFSYLAYTKDPDELFSWADVVCLPSYREGFAMTLLQAGNAGVLLLVSNIPGCTEMLKSKELVFEAGDIQKLTSCFEKIKSLDPKVLAQIAHDTHKHISSRYSEELVYSSFFSILNKNGDKKA
jgi:glycosyltransferase involved in cell wall biosynthesis